MSKAIRKRTDAVPAKIGGFLKKHFPPDSVIDVSASGVRDNLHVLVVSRELDNMTEMQKQEHVWALLDDAVKQRVLAAKDLRRVSVVLPFSVDELRR